MRVTPMSHHEAEHAAPAERDVDPTADHRRDRRRNAKYHRNGAHQALRSGPSCRSRTMARPMAMPTPALIPCTARNVKSHAKLGDTAQQSTLRCRPQARQARWACAERVGQRSEYQRHDREWHKVRRERLLHLPGAERELAPRSREMTERTCRRRMGSPLRAPPGAPRAPMRAGHPLLDSSRVGAQRGKPRRWIRIALQHFNKRRTYDDAIDMICKARHLLATADAESRAHGDARLRRTRSRYSRTASGTATLRPVVPVMVTA